MTTSRRPVDEVTAGDSRSLRILVCTPRFPPQVGGAETWLRGVVTGLAERGHDVTVVAAAFHEAPDRYEVDGCAVRRARGGRIAFARTIAASTRDVRPDVAISQYSATAP